MRFDVYARVTVQSDDAIALRLSVPNVDDKSQARAAVQPLLSRWPHVIEKIRAVKQRQRAKQ